MESESLNEKTPEINRDPLDGKTQREPKKKKLNLIFFLTGIIPSFFGSLIFLLVTVIGAALYDGKVYYFDGFAYTAAFCGIAIACMLIGLICSAIFLFMNIKKFKDKKYLVKLILAIVAIVLSITFTATLFAYVPTQTKNGASAKSLQKAYDYADCAYPWATHGNDWTYIYIDTNPYDYDSSDYPALSTKYASDALRAIRAINNYYNLPDSLLNEMKTTTALMGKQTKTYSSVVVSWTYHPDNGLQVMYSKS